MFSSTAKRAKWFPAGVAPGQAIAALLIAILFGCEEATAAPSVPNTTAHPIFWQVDAPGIAGQTKAARLYLLGSIHVGPKGGWQLPASIIERFEASEALIVEVDMSDRSGAESQENLVLAHGLLPAGESIKNHVSEATYAALTSYADKRGRSLANLNSSQAWMIATLLLTVELERLGYPSEGGVDLDMIARAGEDQSVVGLETMEEQLSMLSSMSKETQELMLKDMLLQVDEIEAYFEELKEAWRTGDEARLEAVLFDELEQTPKLAPFYEHAIYGRNETMCKSFREHLAKGGTRFGVVGTYHITGERGIPACLKRHGYKVKRLRDTPASR